MLKGKVAIVTGSTSGIGLGIARALAGEGADIVLNGFGDPREIAALRDWIERAHGVRVVHDAADVSKGTAVRDLVATAVETLGRVDILVNNAGIQFTAPVEAFPAERWDAILAVNLSAAFHGIAAALPWMRERGWGRIVNVASAHGLVGSTHKAAYVAAKHGLVGLTKVVGLETAGTGVTANAICPGWVRTPLVEKQIADIAAERAISRRDAAASLLGEKQPSQAFVTPEQLGGTVVFLCSPAADQITGTAIAVDGAWTAQ
ncbi:3-hydroxybutyrate dehydrogenase [Azospirillum sp. ST 5-10]|uniref:3-hydroxybutyrate dehydrogenase n=1 Tax=unclassified Azospirillum TaxID=2630922 RepID=UPI003F4A2856